MADNKKVNKKSSVKDRPWSPSSLGAEERELYDLFVERKNYVPSNTWADGSPRNPMPEVKDQLYHDYVRAIGYVPANEWADGTFRDPLPDMKAWLRGETRKSFGEIDPNDIPPYPDKQIQAARFRSEINGTGAVEDRRPRITPEDLRRLKPEVNTGFDQALASENYISGLREGSPVGMLSPKAAVMDAVNEAITALSPEEVARGRRHAKGAAAIAEHGRHGDTMLVHMAPEEVEGLASLRRNGVTINPKTGLPEMFNLREMIPTIATIGSAFLPFSALGRAAISGLATAASTKGTASEKIGKGLLSGIGTWGTGQLLSTLGSSGATTKELTGEDISNVMLQSGEDPQGVVDTMSGSTTEELGMHPKFSHLSAGQAEGLETAGITPDKYKEYDKYMTDYRIKEPHWFSDSGTTLDDKKLYYSDKHLDRLAKYADPAYSAELGKRRYEDAQWFPKDSESKFDFLKGGLENISSDWETRQTGEIGLQQLAMPLTSMAVGVGGTMPEPEYEVPGMPTYQDRGPYYPERRRRRQFSSGYIPGVSPQESYFIAKGGTAGKTVSGGLPTIYAQGGASDIMEAGTPTGASNKPASQAFSAAEVAENVAAVRANPNFLDRNTGFVTEAGKAALAMPISEGGIGGWSPGIGLGTKGELADKGVTIDDVEALIASTPDSGYVISDPSGHSLASQRAAEVAGRINPTMSSVISSLGSLATGGGGTVVSGLASILNPNSLASNIAPDLTGTLRSAANKVGGFLGSPDQLASNAVIEDASDTVVTDAVLQDDPVVNTLVDDQQVPVSYPHQQFVGYPIQGYRPGVDPTHTYYAQAGTEGMTVEEDINIDTSMEVPAGTASTTGIMEGAPVEVQSDVEARLMERSVEEPQNPRERAIYDRVILALQGELEPEIAESAIEEFLELFGPEAYRMIQEMVAKQRDTGGIVETATEETTVGEGELQGPDIIAGKVVDPVSGEETANLRVGENEYIEPAASLARRAQVAGLPPTPENGAMIRGEEERMLRQAVG